MGEALVDLAWMSRAALAKEREQLPRPPPVCSGPLRVSPLCAASFARLHERLDTRCHESIVDERVFGDIELFILLFEISRPIVLNPVTQDQILRTRGRADRVGLHKPHALESFRQRHRREETARDGVASKLWERNPHETRSVASSRLRGVRSLLMHRLRDDNAPG